MSYCRWSSMDYQCDAYVWHDVSGGWCTEIAGRRRVFKGEAAMPPPVTLPVGEDHSPEREAWAEAVVERWAAVAAIVDDERLWDWLDLPEPDGGRSFWHASPGECADNLESLRAAGYVIPDSAIASLRAEHQEATDD